MELEQGLLTAFLSILAGVVSTLFIQSRLYSKKKKEAEQKITVVLQEAERLKAEIVAKAEQADARVEEALEAEGEGVTEEQLAALLNDMKGEPH